MSTVKADISAKRAANSSRPGRGARSRTNSLMDMDPLAASAAMLDLDHRAGSEPHQFRRRIFQANTNRETLCNPHPIEGTLDIRNRARNVDAVLVRHTPTDALYNTFDRHVTIDHGKHCRAVADLDGPEVGLPEVSFCKPFFGVDQCEQRSRGRNHFTRRNGK